MNKIKYLIIAILTVGFVQAQDELNLPNYTPPSPEASAMTKYADLLANEFKGMVSHTIPLYTYKASQFCSVLNELKKTVTASPGVSGQIVHVISELLA